MFVERAETQTKERRTDIKIFQGDGKSCPNRRFSGLSLISVIIKKNQQFKNFPLTFKNTDVIFAFIKTSYKIVLPYPA